MSVRSSTLGVFAAIALALPSNPSGFTLGASGAVDLAITGDEAQYSLSPASVEGHPMITISLGATSAEGSLMLFTPGDRLPSRGRYPILFSWDDNGIKGPQFHACFVAGAPTRPLGWFHGESGWVTITGAEAGRLSGEFEIRARGFLTTDPNDENQWVTVRGSFEAHGDSTIAVLGE